MVRQPCIKFPGTFYHVMCRGDRREPIFEDDDDRRTFLRTLAECCEKSGWRIYAWVLMSNHYHWVLQTPEANLVAGMKCFRTPIRDASTPGTESGATFSAGVTKRFWSRFPEAVIWKPSWIMST